MKTDKNSHITTSGTQPHPELAVQDNNLNEYEVVLSDSQISRAVVIVQASSTDDARYRAASASESDDFTWEIVDWNARVESVRLIQKGGSK
jgi:hypothetical protein